MSDPFAAQIRAAYVAYRRAVAEYVHAKLGIDSARAAGRINDTRKKLVRLAAKVPGLSMPPRFVTGRHHKDAKQDWGPWDYAVQDWGEGELEARLAASAQAEGSERPAEQPRELLDDNEYTVLRELRDKRPRLVQLPDLEACTGIGRKTCKRVVTSLIERGLAHRPSGRGGVAGRRGATITPTGERLLDAADAPRTSAANGPLKAP